MVEEDSRWVSPVEGVDTTSVEENCCVWILNLRWNGLWMSGCIVLRRFGGVDVTAWVGNHNFLQECNPLDAEIIHYRGHAAEVQGRGCTPYLYCFGRRFDVLSCSIFQRFFQDIIGIKVISDHHVLVTSSGRHRKNGMFGQCRVFWKSQWLKKNLMGYLCDDFRWHLRLELLRLCGVGSLELLFDVDFDSSLCFGQIFCNELCR